MSDVAIRQETAVATTEPVDLLSAVVMAARDPQTDITKMERLIELKRQIDADNAKREYTQAMARVQPNMPQIGKDGAITVNGQVRSRYSTYEHLDRVMRPIYGVEGFSIEWNTQRLDKDLILIVGTLQHRAGYGKDFNIVLPPDTMGSKSAVQSVNSAISQGRRSLLKMMFNVVETVEEVEDPAQFQPITDQQKAELVALLRALPGEFDANVARFLKFMGVDELADIQQMAIGKAKQALASKVRAAK